MRIILFLITLLFVGCIKFEKEPERENAYSVETEISSMVEQFYQDANDRGVYPERRLIATITDNDSVFPSASVVGLCQTGTYSAPRVYLRRSFFNSGTAKERKYLIYHELGHCLIGRPHRNTVFNLTGSNETVQVSLMYPMAINAYQPILYNFVVAHESAYVDELFHQDLAYQLASYGGAFFEYNPFGLTVATNHLETETHLIYEDGTCEKSN